MCFWATRYDCFVDKKELKLGVETIRRLLPEVEKDMPEDRRIAPMFDWDEIKDNTNLPYPYVVSFSSRPDNDYMWHEYAKEYGVVLEIDDTVSIEVPDAPLLRLASCIYVDGKSDDKMTEMLLQEYTEVCYRILGGPQKEQAFTWLKDCPLFFLKLIALGLIFVTAPRIKDATDYWMEEETRAIIPLPVANYSSLIEGHDETITKLGLDPTELRALVANELTRQREDGSIMFYREMRLPIDLLKSIYVKEEATRDDVCRFVAKSGLNVPVTSI